jgi:hypothetical protein
MLYDSCNTKEFTGLSTDPEVRTSMSEMGYNLGMRYNGLLDVFSGFDISALVAAANREAGGESRFERIFHGEGVARGGPPGGFQIRGVQGPGE